MAHHTEATPGGPKHDEENNIQPERFKDRIIFMPMHNDIDWGEKAMKTFFVYMIPQVLLHTPQSFPKDIGHSSDLDLKKNGTPRSLTNQTVRGTESLN